MEPVLFSILCIFGVALMCVGIFGMIHSSRRFREFHDDYPLIDLSESKEDMEAGMEQWKVWFDRICAIRDGVFECYKNGEDILLSKHYADHGKLQMELFDELQDYRNRVMANIDSGEYQRTPMKSRERSADRAAEDLRDTFKLIDKLIIRQRIEFLEKAVFKNSKTRTPATKKATPSKKTTPSKKRVRK